MCPSTPALSASCPWPGTTASPCAWSCWAATSRRPGEEGRGCSSSPPGPRPARPCLLLLRPHTPPSPCPQTRAVAKRAPLPRVGAGAAALHFMGPSQVGCGDGFSPFVPLARDETPSCNRGLAGGPSPATGALLEDPVLQPGLVCILPAKPRDKFSPPFCFCFQQRGCSQQQSPAYAGAQGSAVLGGLWEAPQARSLRHPSGSLHGCKQGL